MDSANKTTEQISKKLRQLRIIAGVFMSWYIFVLILDGMLLFLVGPLQKVTSTPKFGKIYMIGSLVTKTVEVMAHIYLLMMGFKI